MCHKSDTKFSMSQSYDLLKWNIRPKNYTQFPASLSHIKQQYLYKKYTTYIKIY